MDKKLLGRKINIARKEAGFTSEKLSELCSINATYLRQIEAGVKSPSLPVFTALCQELKVSPSYLLADILEDCETQGADLLFELWRTATPKQLKLITSMVKSALEVCRE